MNQKEYIINVLEGIKEYWEGSESIINAIKNGKLNTDTLNIIEEQITKTVVQTTDELAKEKLENAMSLLKNYREIEKNERNKEKKELENIDSLLEDL